MFISYEEKAKLKRDIRELETLVDNLNSQVIYLIAKVKTLSTITPRIVMAEDRIAKKKEYSRKYYAKKKLERKNATSISTTGQ
jgi:hypothetical protein